MENKDCMSTADGLSRRGFLTGAGVAVAGVATVAALPALAHADEPAAPAPAEAAPQIFDGVKLAIGHVVHDPSLCSGCRTCEIVCSTYHEGKASSELSRIQWTKDLMDACITDIMTCKQCAGAECVTVCPTGALSVDETTGARVINEGKCVGCKTCLSACPVVPSRIRYNAEKDVCFKCDLCDGDPQCVKFCPMGALKATWVEDEGTDAQQELIEKDFTGDAAAFTHMEQNAVAITDGDGGAVFTGVLWTSHATMYNIVQVDYTVTADALDASGKVIASSAEPATASIPEMSSANITLTFPGVKASNVAKVVVHAQGTCVTNAPGQEG